MTRIQEEKNKSSQPVKQKPVSGLRALIKNEATKKPIAIKARVVFDYTATAGDELTLTIGDIVTILDKNLEDEGWWKVDFLWKKGKRSLPLIILGGFEWTSWRISR